MNTEEQSSNIDIAQLLGQAGAQSTMGAAAQVYLEEQTKALAERQLDVKKMREECYYLLKQYSWNPTGDGTEWTPPITPSANILTDWGVDRLMQIIHFYINQNNLLSNFKDDEIKYIMQKFLLEVNDLVLLKYEFLFREPTNEECESIFLARLENKIKVKKFSLKMMGREIDEIQLKEEVYETVIGREEYEIKKIKQEQRKQRLREFSMILAQLEVLVLGALNRALNGEERGSLRRHTQMLEMMGSSPAQAKETGGMFKWLKGN